MDRKPKTIQDVARAAGVSTATVSRTLSQPQVVSEATRDAVMEAVRATGYRVNQAARNLRRQRAGAVLVLVPNLGNPFYAQILSGLAAGFAESEYSVLILDTNHLSGEFRELVDYFVDSRVAGMVMLGDTLPPDALAAFEDAGLLGQIVCACEWIDGTDLPSVRSDNGAGTAKAIRHLHDLGHRRIAQITGPEGNVLTQVRRDVALSTCADLGVPMRGDWVFRGTFSMASGRAVAGHLAALTGADRPTAVFCASDEIAFGLISGLHDRGIRVPQDISVVGFDDIETAEIFIPPLTTIRQDRLRLGRQAARRLLRQLAGGPQAGTPEVEYIDVTLVERGSTAAPPPDPAH